MITIEINDAEFQAVLNRVTGVLADTTAMMNKIGAYLRDQTEDRFDKQAAPDGTAWAPRSAATLKNYARRGLKHGGILHLTGQLSGNIFHDYGLDWTRIGSAEPYAAVQQFGAAQGQFGAQAGRTKPSEKRPKSQDYFVLLPWGDIPARPFLGFADEDREGVREIAMEALARAMQG